MAEEKAKPKEDKKPEEKEKVEEVKEGEPKEWEKPEKESKKKEKEEKPKFSLEREYVIPLRKKYQKTARYKKTPKAIRAVKEFLVRHMKVRDRDLNKIKLDKYLNEYLWKRGIKNPPHNVKVKAALEADTGVVRVELAELPKSLEFKKARHDRRETKAQEGKKKKVTEAKPKEPGEITEGEKKEEKEKKESVKEAAKELEKTRAKEAKHTAGGKNKGVTHPQRKAMQK